MIRKTQIATSTDNSSSSRMWPPASSSSSSAAEKEIGSPSMSSQGDATEPTSELKRTLGFWDGFAVVVGIMIGSGIFASPGLALERAGSPALVLLAWIAAGVLVAISILCYAELAAMIPTAGGDFDYLKRAYGDAAAFSFAWYNFWISKPGSQAIIATVFGEYCIAIFSGNLSESNEKENISGAKMIAVLLVVALTLINCAGVRESANLQNILAAIKLVLVVFIAGMALVYRSSHPAVLIDNLSLPSTLSAESSLYGFFTAMVACLWAFDGWADLNFLAEEVVEPERVLPLVMLTGVATVTVCYLLVNLAYLSVLDASAVASSTAIAIDLGNAMTSSGVLPTLLALGVVVSTAGSANGSIMSGGRAFYAIARVGFAPRVLSKLNKHGSPWTSLLAQGSSFSSLLNYFGPSSWLFYAFTASGAIVLRIYEPDVPRPFRIPLYPLPPLIVFISSLCIVFSSLAIDPLYCSLALGFVALSFPVWHASRLACIKSICGIPITTRAISLPSRSGHGDFMSLNQRDRGHDSTEDQD